MNNAAVRTIADLPAPKGLLLLGNLHQLADALRMHLTLERWARELGPIYRFKVGRRSVVALADPEAIDEVLKARPDTFRRWKRQQQISAELQPRGLGVFHAEGNEWKAQRRLVLAALNTSHLRRYFEVIRNCGLRLHRRLDDAANGRATLDVAHTLNSFTIDITCGLVFGQDLNTLERGENELQHHFEVVMTTVMKRITAPFPYWRLPIPLPGQRAIRASSRAIDDTLVQFLEQARARVEARPELLDAPENLLDAMLGEQHHDRSFTDLQILGNINTLLFAGEDTTAQTLGWATWLLAARPDVQERLAAEARDALGDDVFPADHETVGRLEYGDAVMREVTRLKPVAPMLTIEAQLDTTVCGTQIPAGTEFMLLTREAARHKTADEAELRPERWLGDGETPPKTLAFGSGPRFCPGRNLAMIEVKSALAMITRHFEIMRDPAAPDVEERVQFTMAPAGLQIKLRPRALLMAATQIA